jgi:hypothetical protein
MRIAIALGLVMAVLPAGVAGADQDPVDARAPLIGHVVDRSGHGVRGVCIVADQVHDVGHDGTYSGRNGRFILDTTSWGRPETYYVIRLEPCDQRLRVAPEYFPHADHVFASTAVKVRAGHTTHQEFVVRREAVLEGTVTAALGQPFAYACVVTGQWDQTPRDDEERVTRVRTADRNGHYRFSQLTPGLHRIAVYNNCSDPTPLATSGDIRLSEGGTGHLDLSVLPVVDPAPRRSSYN